MSSIDHVVFDLGNVLVRWDRAFLIDRMIADPAERRHVLDHVITMAFHTSLDRGRDWAEAVATLSAEHPRHADVIAAYDARWLETVGGPVPGSADLVRALKAGGYRLHLLSNVAEARYHEIAAEHPVLELFETRALSGALKMVKPEPGIYRWLEAQAGFEPARTVFLDDSLPNCEGARACGWHAIHFRDVEQAKRDLRALGVFVPV